MTFSIFLDLYNKYHNPKLEHLCHSSGSGYGLWCTLKVQAAFKSFLVFNFCRVLFTSPLHTYSSSRKPGLYEEHLILLYGFFISEISLLNFPFRITTES